MAVDAKPQMKIDDKDFRTEWFSGTGAGGQHRNKSQNSCRVIHVPTGISETRQSRSRENNQREAKAAVIAKLQNHSESQIAQKQSENKKLLVGSGMRGDKIITIQFQNDKVTHHLTGKTCRVKDFMSGKMFLTW